MKQKQAMRLWPDGNYLQVVEEKWQSLPSFIYLGIFARPACLASLKCDSYWGGKF